MITVNSTLTNPNSVNRSAASFDIVWDDGCKLCVKASASRIVVDVRAPRSESAEFNSWIDETFAGRRAAEAFANALTYAHGTPAASVQALNGRTFKNFKALCKNIRFDI